MLLIGVSVSGHHKTTTRGPLRTRRYKCSQSINARGAAPRDRTGVLNLLGLTITQYVL